jgi:hypothetical protein
MTITGPARAPIARRPDAESIATSIARTSFLRRSTRATDGGAGHTEWLHFSIGGSDLTLLVNLSMVDDLRPSAPIGGERGRIVVLVRDAGRWDGGAEEVDAGEMEVHGGTIRAVLGNTRVDFDGGVFRLTGCLREREVAFDLELRPISFPSLATNVALGRGAEPINWAVVPSLRADGWLSVDGRRRELRSVLAYHDHNWGYFSHRDFAWQWGHATSSDPSRPLSFVFTRLLNAAQTEVHMQALLLWSGGRQLRVFREQEVHVATEGFLRKDVFTVPKAARLLAGPAATDIPKRLRFEAAASGDTLVATFEAEDAARIVVANEHDLGTTLIHEVAGRLVLRGTVSGAPIDFEAHAVFEWLGRGP